MPVDLQDAVPFKAGLADVRAEIANLDMRLSTQLVRGARGWSRSRATRAPEAHRRAGHPRAHFDTALAPDSRTGVEGGLELVALFPSPSHGFLVTERAAGTCGWRERAPWGRFGDRPADPLRVLDL